MEKYLRHYAEAEIFALDGLPAQPDWHNVVVIPACNEGAALLRPPPACRGRSLLILVINEPAGAAPVVAKNNLALANEVRARFEPLWRSTAGAGLSLWRDPDSDRDLLLADRFSENRQLPAGEGVGLARKIGADLALALIQRKRVRSNWIHCSDADVTLPETYFSRSDAVPNADLKAAALVYPFTHVDSGARKQDQAVVLATQLYELSLRYYVAGMKSARSPYAFHTIGSTMAVDAVHYAKVRGFPKREAAEDFYLLNKLAKVGSVLELAADADADLIRIESRRSERVPFGTGAAVNTITAMPDPVETYLFYDPAVFGLLKAWLDSLPAIWRSGSPELSMQLLTGPSESHRRALLDELVKMKTQQALAHAFRQSGNFEQFSRQLHTWFDAFRTLKLIHALRDSCLPSVNHSGLAAHPAFRRLLAADQDLLGFHQRLCKRLATWPGSAAPRARSVSHMNN